MQFLNIKAIFILILLSKILYSDVLIPNNKCALIVASRATISESKDYIKNQVTNKKYVNLYQSNNGWYAISIGFIKNNNVRSILKKWKNSGKIPMDSFCAKANKFVSEIDFSSGISGETTSTRYKSQTRRQSVRQPTSSGIDICQYVSGASILADDGKYLGKISSEYASESIFNEYGTYGSEYSSDSIWNTYGSYGGKYATGSPFNPYSSVPPILVKNGQLIAYLSVNKALNGAINPYFLKTCTFY